jgi:adenine-specific DNA-methyltransferase
MTIRELIENKATLDYQQICTSLIEIFRVDEKVNWESVLPAQQQQEYFGGETLRVIAEHPILSRQKDIRPISLKRGSISQMLFFYVTLQDPSLPKKQIQDVTKKFISGGDAHRYIIWFFGNKDSTALKVVLSAKEGKKVVLKTLPFEVNQPFYKTYTYILNEVNQKVNQLFVEPTDLWKALWTAFDISVINKNFYDEIKVAFNHLLTQLNKKGNPFTKDEDRVQFAIRLIGRIIFCWFLKRKEILGDEAISSGAIRAFQNKNYYHDLLEPLFFDVLNTPQGKGRKAGLPKTISQYPFLNGGLFEDQKTDYKNHLLLDIDNDWFYEIFSKTLERYNFTVDENSSSNAEIAIDPEMLGRIFENLLAEQNPETGESARKATGSFYTPREIVDYMVEQSIAEILKTALKADEQTNASIEDFVHTQILPDSLIPFEEQLRDELVKIKVLDPACGSGAFPIGVLQKIVALKQQLHPKSKNYKLKLDTIQNSIYGVDIQPMAVELSRLRCWLSLVVDEDPKDIKALPNLDFKFVCADSLIEVGKLNHQLDLSKSAERIEDLKSIRTEFFIASGKRKKDLEKKFTQVQASLNSRFLEWDGKSKLVENLASWKPFENQKTNWFDAFWMFGLTDGFDIVIGNPPYIPMESLLEESRDSYRKKYKMFQRKFETSVLFVVEGLHQIKEHGIVCYIAPMTWQTGENYKRYREYLLKHNGIIKVLNLPFDMFDNAYIDTGVLIFTNRPRDNYSIFTFDKGEKHIDFSSLSYEDIAVDRIREPDFKLILEKSLGALQERFVPPQFVTLGEISKSTQGLSGSMFKKSENDARDENIFPFLLKGNVYNYKLTIDEIQHTSLKDKASLKQFYQAEPKILIRRIVNRQDRLSVGYCEEKLVFKKDINPFIIDKSEYSTKYVLAILASKFISHLYVKTSSIATKDDFRQTTLGELRKLPIPAISMEQQQPFIKLVEYILQLKKTEKLNTIHQSVSDNLIVTEFEDTLDGMVLELFFKDELREKRIDIIKLVEEELQRTKGNNTTERIYNFYKAISHPDSEIHNRILSFALVSPDILKPILQG